MADPDDFGDTLRDIKIILSSICVNLELVIIFKDENISSIFFYIYKLSFRCSIKAFRESSEIQSSYIRKYWEFYINLFNF
jgi:hypothetical protein